MVKAEIDMLKELIAGLDGALSDYSASKDPEKMIQSILLKLTVLLNRQAR